MKTPEGCFSRLLAATQQQHRSFNDVRKRLRVSSGSITRKVWNTLRTLWRQVTGLTKNSSNSTWLVWSGYRIYSCTCCALFHVHYFTIENFIQTAVLLNLIAWLPAVNHNGWSILAPTGLVELHHTCKKRVGSCVHRETGDAFQDGPPVGNLGGECPTLLLTVSYFIIPLFYFSHFLPLYQGYCVYFYPLYMTTSKSQYASGCDVICAERLNSLDAGHQKVFPFHFLQCSTFLLVGTMGVCAESTRSCRTFDCYDWGSPNFFWAFEWSCVPEHFLCFLWDLFLV